MTPMHQVPPDPINELEPSEDNAPVEIAPPKADSAPNIADLLLEPADPPVDPDVTEMAAPIPELRRWTRVRNDVQRFDPCPKEHTSHALTAAVVPARHGLHGTVSCLLAQLEKEDLDNSRLDPRSRTVIR
jgi:hypothetical protein